MNRRNQSLKPRDESARGTVSRPDRSFSPNKRGHSIFFFFFFCLFVKWNYDAIDATSIWEKVVQQEGNDGSSFHLPFWCRLPVGWSGQCATPQLRTPFLCPVGRERKKKRKFLNCYKSVTLGPKRLWIRIDNADTLVFWRRRVCIVVQHVYLHQSW